MLRSNGDCGEVRKGHSISVPYRTVHEASAWGSKGVVSSMFTWTARSFISTGDAHSLVKFINSWSGHAKWADTHNLFSWMENRHGITV